MHVLEYVRVQYDRGPCRTLMGASGVRSERGI